MATRYDILQLIPQRPPIVMVTAFDGFDGNTSLTTFAIQPDNLFVADGKLQESGVIEHPKPCFKFTFGFSASPFRAFSLYKSRTVLTQVVWEVGQPAG